MAEVYFSGQGKVYLFDRAVDTTIAKGIYVGNCPALSIAFNTETVTHKESTSGQRLEDFRLVTQKGAEVNMTLEVFSKQNLIVALYGAAATQSTTPVTNEALPSGIVAGDYVSSKKYPFTTFSITDSAAIPATLAATTNYVVESAQGGIIRFVNVGSFTQPFKLNYTPVAKDIITMFEGSSSTERFLRFVGLNTANADDPVIVDLYRLIFDPTGNLALINDELGQFELTGTALFDSTRDLDSTLGGFGRVILNTP